MDQSNFRENRLINSESSNQTINYGSSILAFPILHVCNSLKGFVCSTIKRKHELSSYRLRQVVFYLLLMKVN